METLLNVLITGTGEAAQLSPLAIIIIATVIIIGLLLYCKSPKASKV
jgi:hypothetical protein